MEHIAIPLPQMGANDTSATIVEWGKENGEEVRKGEVICVAETTKSVFDIEAPANGFLTIVESVGADVPVGEPIAVVSSQPAADDDVKTWLESQRAPVASADAESSGWTLKAEMLAKKHGIDIATVTSVSGGRVTEADVNAHMAAASKKPGLPDSVRDLVIDPYPANRVERILVVGGGQGAVQVIDAISKCPNQMAVAVVDDSPELLGRSIAGVPIVGGTGIERVMEMKERREFDSVVISVSSSIPFRERIFKEWSARGIRFANVIHPSAAVGINVQWGEGNIILGFCHIGPCATIGNNNFLSAYCSIEHHSILGDHCSFGPGVVFSGGVVIADKVRFGTGIFIEPHVHIGTEAVIGSGCIIWKDVPEKTTLKSKLNYSERRRG